MPRRTLTASMFWVHERRKPSKIVPLSAIDGHHDYLSLFHGFVSEVSQDHLHDKVNERWTSVIHVKPIGRSVIIDVETGLYGERGRAINTETGAEEFEYDRKHAIQVLTHGVMLVPPNGTHGLLFQERSGMRSGAGRVHDTFVKSFEETFPDLKVKSEQVLESEAWLRAAHLKAVNVHIYRPSADLADADIPDISDAAFTYSIAPSGSAKHLPRSLYDKLASRKLSPKSLVGLGEDVEVESTSVTLEFDNRSKTFALGNEKEPFASLLLTTHRQDAPSRESVTERSLKEASDYFERMGETWSEANTIGAWTSEALEVRTVMPREQQQT